MISHEEKLCSKMLVTHPQNTPASVGTLVAKRMHCTQSKCSVTKVGLCIDVKEPIFVPWEDLVAWVTEARGVAEYGAQRQYGFGFGFFHPETGEKYSLEFETYGF